MGKMKYKKAFRQEIVASSLVKLLNRKEHYDRAHDTLHHPYWELWVHRDAMLDYLHEPAHSEIRDHIKEIVATSLTSIRGLAAVVIHLSAENPESFKRNNFFSLEWLKEVDLNKLVQEDPNPKHWIVIELTNGAGTEAELLARMKENVLLLPAPEEAAPEEPTQEPTRRIPRTLLQAVPDPPSGQTLSWPPDARANTASSSVVRTLAGPPTLARATFPREVDSTRFVRALVDEARARSMTTVYAVVRIVVTRGDEEVRTEKRSLRRGLLVGRGLNASLREQDYDLLDLDLAAAHVGWAREQADAGVMIREDSVPRFAAVCAFYGLPPRRTGDQAASATRRATPARVYVQTRREHNLVTFELPCDRPEDVYPPHAGDRVYLQPPGTPDNLFIEFLVVEPGEVKRPARELG